MQVQGGRCRCREAVASRCGCAVLRCLGIRGSTGWAPAQSSDQQFTLWRRPRGRCGMAQRSALSAPSLGNVVLVRCSTLTCAGGLCCSRCGLVGPKNPAEPEAMRWLGSYCLMWVAIWLVHACRWPLAT